MKEMILRNSNTGEERPLIRCGLTGCSRVIHLGEEMGYDKNYDVFCKSCSANLFVASGQIDDDWISGDEGWEEVEKGEIKKIRVKVQEKTILTNVVEYICEVDDSIDLEYTPIGAVDDMDFDGADAMGFGCKKISSKIIDGYDFDCEIKLIDWEEIKDED